MAKHNNAPTRPLPPVATRSPAPPVEPPTEPQEATLSPAQRAGQDAYEKALAEGVTDERAGELARAAALIASGVGPVEPPPTPLTSRDEGQVLPSPQSVAPPETGYRGVGIPDHPNLRIRADSDEEAIEIFNAHYGIRQTPHVHRVAMAPRDGEPAINEPPKE